MRMIAKRVSAHKRRADIDPSLRQGPRNFLIAKRSFSSPYRFAGKKIARVGMQLHNSRKLIPVG